MIIIDIIRMNKDKYTANSNHVFKPKSELAINMPIRKTRTPEKINLTIDFTLNVTIHSFFSLKPKIITTRSVDSVYTKGSVATPKKSIMLITIKILIILSEKTNIEGTTKSPNPKSIILNKPPKIRKKEANAINKIILLLSENFSPTHKETKASFTPTYVA